MEENKIQELVKSAQAGDDLAFGQIYDIYSGRIFNFLVVRLRHRQTAEDLVHTVFLKAWSNLKTYQKGSAKFSTWLFQIANYTLIDHWRTRKTVIEIDKVENLSAFALVPEQYETYGYLWEALDELRDEHKTVLTLRFKEDLSIAEIARVMNKTQVGVRVLQHRALKALRQILSSKGLI